MFKVTIALKLILCYNLFMKLKITAIIGLIFIIGCAPKQLSIFKKHISEHNLTLSKLDDNISNIDKINIIITPNNEFKGGTFKGFSGCNDYNGTFTLNRDYINFAIKDMGQRVCEKLEIESKYIHKLVESKKIVIQGKKIFFKDKNENWLMTFKKADKE